MSNLQIFESSEFGQVRTTTYNGEIAFVANDVCRVLGISNASDATSRLDDDEKSGVGIPDPHGRTQETTVVFESGLYSLILTSRKPEAKAFKRWITHEVIPAIRKHGGYLTPDTIEKVLTDPDFIIGLATKLKNAQAEIEISQRVIEHQQSKIAADKSKVDFAEKVGDCKEGIGLREFGLKFRQNGAGFGQDGLVERLLKDGYCYRDAKGKLRPYAEHTENGLFWMKSVVIECEKGDFITEQLKFTGKGQQYFTDKYMPLSPEVGGEFPAGYFDEVA